MIERVDCVVIGAGVVGLAIARELAIAGREVLVLESEAAFGTQTSARNSEVIHAGIYYPTGSLKARLCVAGRHALYAYCAERGVQHRRTGKLIVATDEGQAGRLASYLTRARANGVDDLEPLTAADIARLEPEVLGVAGLFSPSTGIIDSHGLMLALLGDAERAGATLVLESPVTGGKVTDEGIDLAVGGAEPVRIRCRAVVNAAGHGAPAVSSAIEGVPAPTIPRHHFPVGHYFTLSGPTPFRHLVYPVAPGDSLGIHVTLDLAGRCRFGPDCSWRKSLDYRFDASRAAAFLEAIRRYYPALRDGALQPGYTGIRPRITGPGEPLADFAIQSRDTHGIDGLVCLYGIESPGLTASLAIGAHVRGLLA